MARRGRRRQRDVRRHASRCDTSHRIANSTKQIEKEKNSDIDEPAVGETAGAAGRAGLLVGACGRAGTTGAAALVVAAVVVGVVIADAAFGVNVDDGVEAALLALLLLLLTARCGTLGEFDAAFGVGGVRFAFALVFAALGGRRTGAARVGSAIVGSSARPPNGGGRTGAASPPPPPPPCRRRRRRKVKKKIQSKNKNT